MRSSSGGWKAEAGSGSQGDLIQLGNSLQLGTLQIKGFLKLPSAMMVQSLFEC